MTSSYTVSCDDLLLTIDGPDGEYHTAVPLCYENGMRKILIARKKAEKDQRRFYAKRRSADSFGWDVRDHEACDDVIAACFGAGAEANAKAFAKWKNKQAAS